MKNVSILELLHPDAIARSSMVLGNNCPGILRPEPGHTLPASADLLLLAPSEEEADSKGWLEAAVQTMMHSLSADGVGYVLVPPRWRMRTIKLLRGTGLVVDTVFWHFPTFSSSRYLVPIERFPGQFAVHTILPSPSLKRMLAMQIFRYRLTRRFLSYFWKPMGITVRRPGARPLFQWLFQDAQRRSSATALVRASWRGRQGASIVYGFAEQHLFPSMIAKTVHLQSVANLNRERRVLEQLSAAAREAGVQIPEIIRQQQNEQRSSLLLSFIPGKSVSAVLRAHPERYAEVMTKIVDWLDRWQRATVIVRRLQRERLEHIVLTPFNHLTPSLRDAEKYRDRLMTRGETFLHNSVPLVDAHNDLTMANILLDEHDQLGIVDWETACPESLPLRDFYYAVTDAARITSRSTHWLDAFKACFLPDGPYYSKVLAWHERLQSAISPPPGLIEFCFHACWLHHASNEHQVSQPGEPRPFLEIVQWLALHEFTFPQNQN